MINISQIVKRMSYLRHFRDLSLSDIRAIVQAGHVRKVRAGTTIVTEDAENAGLFVLLSGQVHLYKMGPDGQEVLLYVLNPVIMFNEVAVLDGGPNLLTACASKDCVIWNGEYQSLVALSKKFPEVALGFLPILAARHRELIAMITDVCFRSVRARTAKLLLDLSHHGQKDISRQEHTIYKMSTQISTVPEAISRSLGFFRDKGYIVSTRTRITICQPDQLAQLAQVGPDPNPPEYKLAANSD